MKTETRFDRMWDNSEGFRAGCIITGALVILILLIWCLVERANYVNRRQAPMAAAQCVQTCGAHGVRHTDTDFRCECIGLETQLLNVEVKK